MATARKKKLEGVEKIERWLSDEDNNIWSWISEEGEAEKKTRDTGAALGKALAQALKGVDTDRAYAEPMTPTEIVSVITKHLTMDMLLEAAIIEENEEGDAEEPNPQPSSQA